MTIRAKYAGICKTCGKPIRVGDEIEWEAGCGASHVYCAKSTPSEPIPADAIKISRGQGYGGREFQVGQVLRNPQNKEQILYVLKAGKTYYREDGMSFGVGDEEGYVFYATCRPATEEEAAPLLRREAEAKAAKAQEARRNEIADTIRKNGERPEGRDNIPEGERFSDRQTVYGTGDWFVVGSEWIWYVRNNGMDGDDWSLNNVRTGGAGAIGWRIPYDEQIAGEIRRMTK